MTDRVLKGYRIVEVRHGDTLQAIAARELDDASKWNVIAEINGLTFPYLTGSSSAAGETVKLYGQTILIPAASAQVSAISNPDRVFGVDLDLAGGSLSAADGDLTVCSGRLNLRQALGHRIVTDLRELLFHLPYGCAVRRVLGDANGPAAGLLAAQYVKSALLLDPRVDTVLSCTAAITGDLVVISARIQPVTGTTIDISAEI